MVASTESPDAVRLCIWHAPGDEAAVQHPGERIGTQFVITRSRRPGSCDSRSL